MDGQTEEERRILRQEQRNLQDRIGERRAAMCAPHARRDVPRAATADLGAMAAARASASAAMRNAIASSSAIGSAPAQARPRVRRRGVGWVVARWAHLISR